MGSTSSWSGAAAAGTEVRPRGVILAGGAASRFGGRPKGLVSIGGRRILDRLADALESATGRPPLIIANAPDAAAWRPDLTVVPDRIADAGPLGGLVTALAQADGPVVCVAWDMPFIPAGLLGCLADRLAQADAVLPASGSRRGAEPLCAGYGPACGAAIARQLARGDRRVVGFHPDVRVDILPAETVAQFGPPEFLFFNVNTDDDLITAERLWARHGSSRS